MITRGTNRLRQTGSEQQLDSETNNGTVGARLAVSQAQVVNVEVPNAGANNDLAPTNFNGAENVQPATLPAVEPNVQQITRNCIDSIQTLSDLLSEYKRELNDYKAASTKEINDLKNRVAKMENFFQNA